MTILERGVIVETQVTMFALSKATAAEPDYQSLFAITISFLCIVHAFCVALDQSWTLQKTHKKAVDTIQKLMPQGVVDDEAGDFATRTERCKAWLMGLPGPGTLPMKEDVLKVARHAKIAITVRMYLGTFLLVVITVHVLVKFVMAAYVCPHGFWNIPINRSSLKTYGCVDMSSIKGVMEARRNQLPMETTSTSAFYGGAAAATGAVVYATAAAIAEVAAVWIS